MPSSRIRGVKVRAPGKARAPGGAATGARVSGDSLLCICAGKVFGVQFLCIYVSCEVRAEVAFSTSIFSLCGCVAFPANLALSVPAAHDPLSDCGCASDKQGSPL